MGVKTMAEYITKEQAIHAMEQVTQPECFIEDTRKGFARIIEELPAADVAPVVHGRWEYRKRHEGSQRILTGPLVTGKYPNRITHWDNEVSILFDDRYEWDKPFCSLCGRAAEMPDYMFCPYCGARLDGGESNG